MRSSNSFAHRFQVDSDAGDALSFVHDAVLRPQPPATSHGASEEADRDDDDVKAPPPQQHQQHQRQIQTDAEDKSLSNKRSVAICSELIEEEDEDQEEEEEEPIRAVRNTNRLAVATKSIQGLLSSPGMELTEWVTIN